MEMTMTAANKKNQIGLQIDFAFSMEHDNDVRRIDKCFCSK
jgi:hypothetical protein